MQLIEKSLMQKMRESFFLWMVRWGLPLWIAGGISASQIGNLFLKSDSRVPEAVSEVDYRETLEDVENPGRGFYVPLYVHFRQEDNQVPEFHDKLLHLRMDLAEFSGAYNKNGDEELSEDALQTLEEMLADMEEKHCNAIVRFSYDPGFTGKKSYEPSMEMILCHQRQLGEVISRHAEVIVSVECGIFGKWGEMHGSAACTQENFNQVIDQWLEVLPQSIPISVRTPGQYCGWCGILRSELADQITEPGQKEYRVGIYDDGYLGSETDLGTYEDRSAEVKWLSNQAKHTLFGGEAGSDGKNAGEVGFTTAFLEKEAFLTHSSYLNVKWNQKLISALKSETYEGEEERYRGSDGYVFLRNHMGYRFVLRGVRMTKDVPVGRKLIVETDVENVGFGNLVKPKELTVILFDEARQRSYLYSGAQLLENADARFMNGDPTKWDSKATTTLSASIPITEDVPQGTYQVFLRIAEVTTEEPKYPVRFANEGENVWNESLKANFLGTVQVTEKRKLLNWDFYKGIYWE